MTTHTDLADAESVVEERLAAQLNDATLIAVHLNENDVAVDLVCLPGE